MASNGVLRRRLRLLLLLCSLGGDAAWQLQPTRWQPAPARCRRSCRASVAAIDGGEQVAPLVQSHGNTSASETSAAAETLLNALDSWMRLQTIESVLPRAQAKALLLDLRDDRRFWAQQRTQFNVVWVSLEKALRVEERPLSELLGEMTSDRLLDAIEEMDDDPALINAVLRSEIVEKLLGKVLYEGIFEFVQRADLLGNIFAQLPLLGAIRMQMLKTARSQLDAVLGDSLARFLGEYTASAAESASAFLLSPETASARRRARRSAAAKLLAKPVRDLVQISDIEMALVRDAAWSAIQEFRLPHEEELVDRLYDEFGHQPFTILLPSSATASRGDAPLFSRGRSVLHSIIERFLASGGWSEWAASGGLAASAAVGLELQAAKAREPLPPPSNGKPKKQPPQPPPDPSKWDGWD